MDQDNVHLNQIDIDVLPEAVAASKSKSTPFPEFGTWEWRRAILGFISQNVAQRPTPPQSWPAGEALCMSRLHQCVEWWAERYIAEQHVDEASSAPLERHEEVCRIQRALYRSETFWNLFRDARVERSCYDEKEEFATSFRGEDKLFTCVYEFFLETFKPVVKELEEDGVILNKSRVSSFAFIKGVLSLGLEVGHQIITAETPDDRERARAILRDVKRYYA
ncbi:hypothetical protein O1611_g303 [Lasiodiplodia mahajangana]|uniref:Uncharacterized protein n=1 Tax=Lasiodiplodia mahajangana TaxID=1108764 RepID=A0ACC2K0J0_9PEZI|nr:hypothetical protein O1611_g303 [Lasiodiplodia mahajangana]